MAVTTYRSENNLNRMVAMIVGWVLVLIGVWGFFQDPILAVFDVDVVHNLVHLVTGGVLLAAAYMNAGVYARPTNLTLGIIYLVVMLLGFLTPALLGAIMDFNAADNWLHLLLGIVLGGAAIAAGGAVTRRTTRPVR